MLLEPQNSKEIMEIIDADDEIQVQEEKCR
jgi:hypothetical protein